LVLNPPRKIDLVLVTGFLGSGKTTLIDRQLARPEFPRASTALIINDAGPLNVDARLLKGRAARIEALTGGCACCVTPRQLVEALLRFAQDPAIARVWIEASGVAEPEELLERLTDTSLLEHTALRSVIHVIDARQLQSGWMPGLAHKDHVRWADVVVLTRSDQVAASAMEALMAEVRSWNARAAVLPAAYGACTLPQPKQAAALGGYFLPRFGRHSTYRAVFVPLPRPVSRRALEERLAALPEGVVRVKGFVQFTGKTGGIHFIQVAAGTGRIESWKFGADDVPRGLVCIGTLLAEGPMIAHFEM
jgi:G3E family GTPase